MKHMVSPLEGLQESRTDAPRVLIWTPAVVALIFGDLFVVRIGSRKRI